MKTDGQSTVYPTGDYRDVEPNGGLSKREYFAAMAMQGIRSNNELMLTASDMSIQACNDADALINALNL